MTTAATFNKSQADAGKLTWDHITKLVEFWQSRHGLDMDGKAGDAETIPHLEETTVEALPDLPATLVPIEVVVQGEAFRVYVEDKED